jgi:hypothetical protein
MFAGMRIVNDRIASLQAPCNPQEAVLGPAFL